MSRPIAAEHIFGIRKPLWHASLPFTLGWSHKAGCTFVVKWFLWQIGLLDQALAYHPWVHNYENEVFYRKPNYFASAIQAVTESSLPHIKIIRNPYERAVSAFLIFAIEPSSKPHWSHGMYERIQMHLHGVTDIDHGMSFVENGMSFVEFLQTVKALDPAEVDPHLAPQIQGGERQWIDEMIALESAGQAFVGLEDRFHLSHAPLQQLRGSGHNKRQIQCDAGLRFMSSATRVRFGQFCDNQVPPYRQLLDKTSRRLIREVYVEDFKAAFEFGIEYV